MAARSGEVRRAEQNSINGDSATGHSAGATCPEPSNQPAPEPLRPQTLAEAERMQALASQKGEGVGYSFFSVGRGSRKNNDQGGQRP